MAAKYFVHGGGRWREVEVSSGCVTGWGRVQWVSVRCGRLVALRRARVLRALAGLAAGRPGPARDGPRLPLYSRELEEPRPRQKPQRSINSHCCCGHSHGCNTGHNLKCIPQPAPLNETVDAATQADPVDKIITIVETHATTRKRKLSDSSLDDELPVPITTRRDHNAGHRVVRRHSDTSSSSSYSKKKDSNPTKELIISEEDVLLLRSCIEKDILFPEADLHEFDTNDDYKTLIFYRLNPLVNVERSAEIGRLLREKRSKSQDDVTLDEFVTQLGLKSVKDIKQTRRYKTRNAKRSPRKTDIRKPLSNGQINRRDTSSSDDINLSAIKEMTDANSRPNKRKSYKLSSSGSNTETDKENNSDSAKKTKSTFQEDLRRYIQKNAPFRAKPKKNVNETENNSNNKKMLSDNASGRLRDRSIVISDSDSDNLTKTNSDITKTNIIRRESKRLSAAKKLEETEKKIVENEKNIVEKEKKTDQPRKDPAKKKVGLFFKKRSGSPQKKVVATKIRARPIPKISCGAREYSAAEDAAIVRWVRAEPGRDHRVNGNQLWRQLELQYPALTGRSRSWHSLRNRYLRGVLPALHALPLSAAAAAALRAAAARGNIKSRDAPARHPLFPAPQRGASTRTLTASKSPPPPPRRSLRDSTANNSANKSTNQSTSEPPKSVPKQKEQDSSPTYSELTRRFALRVRSTPTQSPDASPNKSDPVRRTRRLYNPK